MRLGKLQDADTTTEQLVRTFALYLCSEDAPDYFFIDNLEDAELFKDLVLPMARPIVLVTSREHVVPLEYAESLPVLPMEDDEAKNLAHALLPSITDQDMTHLIAKLGNRPLAIEHVCTGLLADGFMTVDEVCAEFDRDAGRTMERATSSLESTFTWIYQRILGRIRQTDEQNHMYTARVLELVALLGSQSIPVDLLRDAFISSEHRDGQYDLADFQAAQREARERYLIRLQDDGFAIHVLTQAVLRSILTREGKEPDLCSTLDAVIRARFGDDNIANTDAIRAALVPYLPHLMKLIRGLARLPHDKQRDIRFGHTAALTIRGCAYIGDQLNALQCGITVLGPTDKWQLAPHLCEAYIEYTKYCYDIGMLSGEKYTDRLYLIQQQCKQELQQVQSGTGLSPTLFLDFTEALLTYGEFVEAVDDIAVFSAMWLPTELPFDVHMRRWTILGEIFHAHGQWEQAQEAFQLALTTRALRLGNNWDFVRLDLRVYKTLVDNALASRESDQAAKVLERAKHSMTRKPDTVADYVSEARLTYIQARVLAARYIERYWKLPYADEVLAHDEALIELATRFVREFQDILGINEKSGYIRISQELLADLYLIGRMTGTEHLIKLAEHLFDVSRFSGSWTSANRFLLVQEKLNILSNIAAMEYIDIVRNRRAFEKIAESVVIGIESPWFYVEYTAISAVYDKMLGDENRSKMQEIDREYNHLGRTDRLFALRAALEALPYDRDEFIAQFVYLLLP